MDKMDNEIGMPLFGMHRFGRRNSCVKQYQPLAQAAELSLTLKVQMKNVTKPPMWRELEVPADFTFYQLHEAIQVAVGLDNSHLWQFNLSAYDDALCIGHESLNPFDMGLHFVTHEADMTPVTQFLQQKGDKLEYVYDFGDDWIFTVEVKGVAPRKSDYPVCTKFKSELNAIEDFGGIWAYLDAREDLADWSKMTKRARKERADSYGFDSPDEYIEFLGSRLIDLAAVNNSLKTL